MAKQNGKVPGTYVSEQELNQLGELLAGFRDYILSHEARLELIEGWINEYHKTHAVDTAEADRSAEAERKIVEADIASLYQDLDEPTDDSEER